jgi:hypothetical protein
VEFCTDCTVQDHGDGDAGGSDNNLGMLSVGVSWRANLQTYDWNGLPPAKPDSQDGGSSLPGSQIDCISGPIRHPSPQSPSLILDLDRIHILISPHMIWGQSRLLLWQPPRLRGGCALLELLLGRNIPHARDVLHLELPQ